MQRVALEDLMQAQKDFADSMESMPDFPTSQEETLYCANEMQTLALASNAYEDAVRASMASTDD